MSAIIFIFICTGGHGLDRRLVLFLGLLNIILLIIAIVIGANCEYDDWRRRFSSLYNDCNNNELCCKCYFSAAYMFFLFFICQFRE